MDYTLRVFLIGALVLGCSALPAQLGDNDDMSIFFEHVDQSSRIIGGIQAAAGSHPHMVSLTDGLILRNFVCGGSIVTQRAVLTAAHCIRAVISWGSLSSSLRASVGSNRWNYDGQTYWINRYAMHEQYNHDLIKNDIGLLFTSSNIQLTALVNTIPLNYNHVSGGVTVRVAGWGRLRVGGAVASSLQELTINTVDGNRCAADVVSVADALNFRAPPVDPALEICTFHAAGTGTCNGDSGSALVRTDIGQQVGIVSWGLPCALGAPDMFVRVSAYRDWILARI